MQEQVKVVILDFDDNCKYLENLIPEVCERRMLSIFNWISSQYKLMLCMFIAVATDVWQTDIFT